jgi:hypothetical protein
MILLSWLRNWTEVEFKLAPLQTSELKQQNN